MNLYKQLFNILYCLITEKGVIQYKKIEQKEN